jgi:O-succinylbenzoate synthase
MRDAQHALDIDACRIINIKPGRVGGLNEARRIHDLCRARGVPVWCGGMLESGIGRAANVAIATLPGYTLPGDISASDRYFKRDIITEPFTLNAEDSTLSVPEGPGLGVEVDMDFLESLLVRQADLRKG